MKKFLTILTALILTFTFTFSFGCKEQGTPLTKEVSLKYADANSVMTMLINDQIEYGLLPEPAATKLEKVKAPNVKWKRIDVQELYNAETCAYPQAVLMVKNQVLADYPQLVDAIKQKFSENVAWAKENPATVISAVKGIYDSTSLAPAKALTADTVENCKINWQDALASKTSVNTYINDILGIEIGMGITPAKKVGASFFYQPSNTQGQAINNKTFTFVVPDGAPALAIAKFINDGQNFVEGATFKYNVVNAETISGYMNGAIANADFIIMPLNSATLNHADNYKLVSVITHGNLYLMSKVSHVDGLLNKTIGVIGEGKVPDLTLKVILEKKGISYKTAV